MKKLLILTLATQLTTAQTLKEEAQDTGAQLAEIIVVPVKAVKRTATKIANSDEVDDIKSVFKQIAAFPGEQVEEIKETVDEIGNTIKDAFIEADIIDDAKNLGDQFAEPIVTFWAGVISFVKTAKAEIID